MDISKLRSRESERRPRTAVLVVHGIGSQRALETVRGVVDATWMQDPKDPKSDQPPRKVWTHPEYSGVDIDLSVMTTSKIKTTFPADAERSIDFHELYWAHLMSETRAVAVLLWLIELIRKGPLLRVGMKALWWGASIFLCMLLASIVLLGCHTILQFIGQPPLVSTDSQIEFGTITNNFINLYNHSYHEPEAIVIAPFFVLCVLTTFVTLSSILLRAFSIAVPSAIIMVVSYAVYVLTKGESIRHITELFLPITISVAVAVVIMGRWGAIVMTVSLLCGWVFFGLSLYTRRMITTEDCWLQLPDALFQKACLLNSLDTGALSDIWQKGWLLWSLNERFSALIAVWMILTYLALYALFLQPYLGDAARYFRNSPGNVAVRRQIRKEAVEMLEGLHVSGRYDRIIVVAHSLGTVVAYDMLRAYFSRICNDLPPTDQLGSIVKEINKTVIRNGDAQQATDLRAKARVLVSNIAQFRTSTDAAGQPEPKKWLVTDFVTLGSALVHAKYLMCRGNTTQALEDDFERRIDEREFPTCPPTHLDPDGLLLFDNKTAGRMEFHHGALFGLTRWTNLYFPLRQLFWGDAIGGPLAELFGPHIRDNPVCTNRFGRAGFFTHTAYWDINQTCGRASPHIIALKEAINLEDRPI